MSRRLLWLALAALAGALCEVTGVALTATAVWLICRAAQQPPLAALAVAIVAVRALAIGRGGFRYLERLAGHDAVLRIMAALRGRFFDALIPLAPTGLSAYRRGDLLANLVSDVDAVQDLLLSVALPAFAVLVVGAAGSVFAATLLPSAGLVLVAGLLLGGLVVPAIAALLSDRSTHRLSAARTELTASTIDLVEGVEDLLLNGATERVAERGRGAARAVAALERRRARSQGLLEAASLLVQLGACTVAGLLAVSASGRLGSVSVAVLVLLVLTVLEVARPLRAAGEALGTQLAALRRLRTILRSRVTDEPVSPVAAPQSPVSLELVDVELRYPGADRAALNTVSLSVPAGARVALVGPSGSGKSTVLLLANRLAAPDAGLVTVSGQDIAELAGADLRPGFVGGLTQDACLFSGSIRSNLLLARPTATETQLWDVLAKAGAERWVRAAPDGLNTLVGRDGGRISGGERQRIVLAMALLSNPAVLLLDEPTESLDPATADAVLADTVTATEGRTVLLVSHRLRGLENLTEIVVLDEGRVIARGSHAELLARPGYYREQYLAELAAPEPAWT